MKEGRKRLTKEQRLEIYRKYDGHCAYCECGAKMSMQPPEEEGDDD